VEEFGSGIAQVVLYYYFESVNKTINGGVGFGSSLNQKEYQWSSTDMIYYKDEECICKWFNLQYNPRADNGQGKMYYHYPRVMREGRVVVLEEIVFPHAPKELWKDYLKKAKIFKESVRTSALRIIKQVKKKKGAYVDKERAEIEEHSKDVIKNYKKFLGTRGGGLNAYKIMAAYGLNNKLGELVRAKATLKLEEKKLL